METLPWRSRTPHLATAFAGLSPFPYSWFSSRVYCSVASHTSFNAQTTRRILEFVRFPSRASPQAPVCSQHTIVQAHQEFVVGEDAAMLTKSPFVRHVQ